MIRHISLRETYSTVLPFFPNGLKSFDHSRFLLLAEDANQRQGFCICYRTFDIRRVHPLIVLQRLVESMHPLSLRTYTAKSSHLDVQWIRLPSKPSTPQLLLCWWVSHCIFGEEKRFAIRIFFVDLVYSCFGQARLNLQCHYVFNHGRYYYVSQSG